VAMGAGLRARVKALELPPDPKVRAPDFYPDFRRRNALGAQGLAPLANNCRLFKAKGRRQNDSPYRLSIDIAASGRRTAKTGKLFRQRS
jgi:hypothetical protein